MGDWREEFIGYDNTTNSLVVFSTPLQTKYRITCLAQDSGMRSSMSINGYKQSHLPLMYLASDADLNEERRKLKEYTARRAKFSDTQSEDKDSDEDKDKDNDDDKDKDNNDDNKDEDKDNKDENGNQAGKTNESDSSGTKIIVGIVVAVCVVGIVVAVCVVFYMRRNKQEKMRKEESIEEFVCV